MGRKQGVPQPTAGSSAPGVTSSSASARNGAAAAQTAPGADEARKLLAQYAKGARCGDALQQLEALHRRSPSHMTCLALAKVRIRQAVDAAVKEDGDDDAHEAAVVPVLNEALCFAAEGAAVHHSANCLGLCDVLMFILCGRPGALERRDTLSLLSHSLPSSKAEALAVDWADTAAELVVQDRWPIEAPEGVSAQSHVQRRLLPLRERLSRAQATDLSAALKEEHGAGPTFILIGADKDHAASPAHVRLYRVAGLPDKLTDPLHRKLQPHQGNENQERRRRHQEEMAGEAERQRAQNRMQLERRKRQAAALQQRVDKVRKFLLTRMAAATGEQQGGGSGAEHHAAQLEALLQQTEVTPEQLQDLLGRAQLPQEQQLAVQRSLGRAEQLQAVCYSLPERGGDALAACVTAKEQTELSNSTLDAARFAAALHKVVWSNPAFAEGQAAEVHHSAEELKQLHQAALSSQLNADVLGGKGQYEVPEPDSLEVLAECPGDMDVLLLDGAHVAGPPGGGLPVAALASAAAATSASLEWCVRGGKSGRGDGRPTGSSKAGSLLDLDSVDDEVWSMGGPSAAILHAEVTDLEAYLAAEEGDGLGPLLILHTELRHHLAAQYMLDVLLHDAEDAQKLFCPVLADRVQEVHAVVELADQHLRSSLLGLELLRLLERRAAAGAATGAGVGVGGRPPTPDEAALRERWDLLQDCWDGLPADKVAEQLAESEADAEQMKRLLRALRERCLSQPLAPEVLCSSVLQLQLCLGAAAVGRAAAAAPGGVQEAFLAAYLLEARRRLAHGVLVVVQTLMSAQRLTVSLLEAVCAFVHHSLPQNRNTRGSDDDVFVHAVLADLGQLPLRSLLQLHAFLALRMASNVRRPKDVDPELQEAALADRPQAQQTQHGTIRLSKRGLAAVGHEVALLEALRANTLGTADEVEEPDMSNPATAAEQLAGFCCGLPQALAEVALLSRGEEASVMEQKLENAQGWEAEACVRMLQRIVYIRRALLVACCRAAPAAEGAEKKLKLLDSLLEQLDNLGGAIGGLLIDNDVRSRLAAQLSQLSTRLKKVADEMADAGAFLAPLHFTLQAATAEFEAAVLQQHQKLLNAEQGAGSKAAEEHSKRVKRELERLNGGLRALEAEEHLLPGFAESLQDTADKLEVLIQSASKHLEGPASLSNAGPNAFDQASLLGSMLTQLDAQLSRVARPLIAATTLIRSLLDVSLEQGRTLEGHLLGAYCMQPSLAPVFVALSRHLLALKWQDDMAAAEAAAAEQQEARRQALLEELLNEDESGQAQAKDDKAKEKRRAKKAARKDRKAAASDAVAKVAVAARAGGVAPMQPQSAENWLKEQQTEGYRRLLEQMDLDTAAAQQAQQQAQQIERPPSASQYFDPAVLTGEEEEWATPLSSPLTEALEASLEGLEVTAAPAGPGSLNPQHVVAAAPTGARSADAQPAAAAAKQQPQRSMPPLPQEQQARQQARQQAQQVQQAQQGAAAVEAWETAGNKRRGKRGNASKPEVAQQQAEAARQRDLPAVPAAASQERRQAAASAGASAPTPQQRTADATLPAERAAAADKAPAAPPAVRGPAADAAPASPAAAASTSPAAAAAPPEDDGWQEAPAQRRRGGKLSAASKPAAGASGRSSSLQAEPVRHYQRVINWAGDWICECGHRNAARSRCYTCDKMESPCREYCFQGGCSRGGNPPLGDCIFPHPPFELPTARRPPTKKGPHLHSKQLADLIADGSWDNGKPCLLPPQGVPLTAGQAASPPPPSGSGGQRAATAPRQGRAAAKRSPTTPKGLLSPSSTGSSTGKLPSVKAPPPGQLRGCSPTAAAPAAKAAAASAAAATASPRQQGPSQRSVGVWKAAPRSPTAAAAAAAALAAPPAPAPRDEEAIADLLDMMGIGEGDGTQAAAEVAGWGEPGSWAHHVGSHELESVEQAPGSWPALGQDAEDAELEAAIQASLADAAATVSRHQSGAWQELPPAPHSSSSVQAANDSEAPALAGLRNEAGEYNCFLNVVVQCLWRCAEFRQQVAGWDASFCANDPVLAALHDLFAQLEQQEVARSSAAANGGGTGSLPPVDPAPLREALAALPGRGFSLGEMNDAAELLLCVYEKVMEAEAAGRRGAELPATFGLAVREEVHCSACGKTTHQTAYTQYFYNTQATTLQMARLVAEGAASMGALLRDAEAQQRKSCDTDMGGCGVLNTVNHFLQGAPRVFTLQVAWETQAPDPDAVAGTLAALDETVDLGEVYQGVDRGLQRYALRSMVCYYGQHYQALVLVPEAGGWLMFDDTRVSRVGSWADVQRKCEAGRIQPSVLFYEAVA